MYVLPTSRRLSTPRHIVSPAPSLRLALIPLLGFAFLSVAQPAAAQNTWMSGGRPVPLWSNAGAWSLNVVPDGSTDISIPDGTVGDDVSFTNRNTLTVGGPATLTILSPTTVTNSGGSGFINNSGSFVNSGTVVNASFGTLNNDGTLTNNATLSNELGGQFFNSGTLDNFGTLDNRISGFIVNTGNLNNQSGGLIINDLSSTIENDHSIGNLAGATFSNSGTLNGSGIFVNSGTVDNSGQLSNAVFNFGGTINNSGGGSIRLGDGSDILGGTLNNAVGSLIVTGPGSTVTLDGSNNSGFGALTINNQGNFQVNSGGGLTTHVTLLGDTTLQGGGTVTLANLGGGGQSIIDAAPAGATLTNVDNTIQGAGRISGFNLLVNQAGGTINANVSGQGLQVDFAGFTNAGLLEATGGGTLGIPGRISSTLPVITNSSGTIAADGGTVFIEDVSVAGGNIKALNGGAVNMSGVLAAAVTTTALNGGTVQVNSSTIFGGSLINAGGSLNGGLLLTLDGSTAFGPVTIQGNFLAGTGTATSVLGTINNQGNIQLNGAGTTFFTTTGLQLQADTTLEGGGTVTLAPAVAGEQNPFIRGTGTEILTNVDNTIQGAGQILGVNLVNQAGGTINANVSGQRLELDLAGLTNAGLLEATGGGTLFTPEAGPGGFVRIAIDNSAGRIVADAGNVTLNDLNLVGGTVTASNGGTVQLLGVAIVGSTLNNVGGSIEVFRGATVFLDGSEPAGAVTIQGTYTGDVGTTTNVLGTINNQGNIQLNGGGGNNASLTLFANTTLQGGGTVTLASTGGGGTGLINSAFLGLTLNNVDNTIQGAGLIDGGPGALQILNQAGGTIRANAPGATLELLNTTLTNAGTVQVDAGSILRVINTPFTQTGGKTQVDGLLSATLGESVSGGTMLGTGTIFGNISMTGGTMRPGGPNVPGTLTIDGDFLQTGSLFDELISGTGNGLLMVNGSATLGRNTNLDVEFADGFTPFAGETFTLMNFTTGAGFFLNAPSSGFVMDGFDWTIAYNSNDIVLDAVSPVSTGGGGNPVPEPGTGMLLLSAIAIIFAFSRLRNRAPIPGT